MQTPSKKSPHVGRNIQTIRLIRGMSQLQLGADLEERLHRPFSQQLVSDIEGKQEIEEEELLRQIADILNVTPEALENLDLNNAISVIGNTYNNNDHSTQNQPFYHQATVHQTFNTPLDRLVDLFENEKTELKAKIAELEAEVAALKKSRKKR